MKRRFLAAGQVGFKTISCRWKSQGWLPQRAGALARKILGHHVHGPIRGQTLRDGNVQGRSLKP